MAREKETRKELLEEPDPVTLYLHRTAAFFLAYRKPIISCVAAFLIIVAAVSVYFYYQARMETAASTLFTSTMEHYAAVVSGNGDADAYEALKKDFRNILDEYGNTKVADMARVQYASVHYRSGDFGEAVKNYETALSQLPANHRFREMALIGLAYSYEGLNDSDNAIAYFEKIKNDPDAAMRDQALFNLGILYAERGDMEKSREAYEAIVSDHTDSMYYEVARDRIGN